MQTKASVLILAACLFLFNFCHSPAAFAARVDVVVDHGVEKKAETQARATINGVFDFFHRTYGIAMQRDIRIKLSCDKFNYKKAIKDWYGASEAQASFLSHSSGLAKGGTLIVDLGGTKGNYLQLFILCHEMVHFYQGQESNDKHGPVRWMSEGVANVIAAHIMETAGGQSSGTWKKYWLERVKSVPNFPRLENLRSPNQMMVPLSYDTASLAVLTLVEWRGYPALFAYFRNLKNTDSENAFYQAFGAKLSDFEKSFRPY
ncbi:MAG: hypothetical protein C4567_18105 [Deltaproteobacteria bacterium]|nr:MAG: hypothetical protein C4567_18105 [Deltaproteobacteria bacterium]